MTIRHLVSALLVLAPSIGTAQLQTANITAQPAVVSVSSQGATTAIIMFSGLGRDVPDSGLSRYVPAEGLWCGRVVVSPIDRGARCDPSTIFGQASAGGVPAVSASGVFTDIMSVPASVVRRAYEAVLAGQPSRFFYVRHFVNPAKGGVPDQYVAVSCLMTGGGASAPFALTNVRLRMESETPVLFVKRGDTPPPLFAEIVYTGTGRLRGRWEIVFPGEELPSSHDLLTEGSLPPAERGLQRRYVELERFNVLLLPTGRFTLPGPDPARLPTSVDGSYMILLRIETSDDGLSDTRVAAGAGAASVIHNGASAGFPMPTLRYIVGESRTRSAPALNPRTVRLRLPSSDAVVSPDSALTLSWIVERGAGRYRVEIERIADGKRVLSAFVAQGVGFYDVPPFVLAQVPRGKVRWCVIALDAGGNEVGRSAWRSAEIRPRSSR